MTSNGPTHHHDAEHEAGQHGGSTDQAGRGIQPRWIEERYPAYTSASGMAHQMRSVREATAGPHHIRITTHYEIEIDGRPVHLHANVGNDGRLRCHSTPYRAYDSAVDLVKRLISDFPEAVAALGQAASHGEEH